ncbi:3-hydroxyacyl-CoA dehydrogenase NAD-binding domain-containing protein [Celeribacter indicus]|uniref:3-hydroxyacyl-CoA dehydrogenase n=1 Tax=Celeribacter indicus TaxID=1208324 RepID=A0A0B5EA50_9RHOB|nr:3-hydroxyacyl-CoA dehydrogenase NAD-binding domain-containing protein [Celeribacter indicus]AJE49162.1 3-hydroxyacyl-CoA dehydrogenase [Celeribacter indicus]SDX17869.1 3-hydroxyacyl-CoA dehydrogenase [Celeribacter indicus]
MSGIDTTGQIGVIGAGTMGAGIAQLAAAAGHEVLLYDAVGGAADTGRARVAEGLEKLVSRGKMTAEAVEALVGRIRVAADLSDFRGVALVVEAIVEKLEVKRAVFAELEGIVGPEAILASNTSSISVTSIARDLEHPERVVGMHFFNPAPIMKLVEVISGVATAPGVAQRVFDTAEAWGKVAVHAKSTPGFIVNRVARPYYAEALRLLEEQVADPATLDALLTEGGGFRMGPFTLMDLIGHDVNYAVSQSVFDAYYQEPRFRPSQIQLELVNAGRLGRKSGRGFYDYGTGAEAPAPRTETAEGTGAEGFALGEPGEIDGVRILPSDGRRARAVATAEGAPAIVHDLIVPGETTRLGFAASPDVPEAAIARFVATLAAQGIAATHLPDWPGLVVLRTVAMLANEGFEAVMQGVADAGAVDAAMRHGVNYPRGPIGWAREIGLGRVVATLDHIHALTGDPRYRASLALRIAAEDAA